MTIGELATLGTVFAMALAAIGAGVAFGRLSQRVSQVESNITRLDGNIARLDSRIDEVREELSELRTEMRAGFEAIRAQIEQTNRILVGLANHRHDTDGTTVFTIPQP